MANLDATKLNDLQATDATNEKRYASLGLVDAAKDSTPFVDYIPPTVREAMSSMDSLRNAQIPVLKDQTVSVVTTPGFNFIPANLPESDQYTFTAVDVFSGFRHYPAQYANNSIDAEWGMQNVMRNVLHAMGQTIETQIATVLESRKTQLLDYTTQVSQGNGTFSFNSGTDILEIQKAAQKETMFFNLEALMNANKLPGMGRIVTNPGGLAVQRAEAAKYGAGNQVNLQALGFYGEDRMYESHGISPASDIFNGWFIRDGEIGLIENFPYDFRNGTEIAGRKWSISDVELPFTRMRANVYVNTEATDATALVTPSTSSNMKMTHFQEMAIWQRYYIVYRYNSDLSTRPNGIVKIKGLTT